MHVGGKRRDEKKVRDGDSLGVMCLFSVYMLFRAQIWTINIRHFKEICHKIWLTTGARYIFSNFSVEYSQVSARNISCVFFSISILLFAVSVGFLLWFGVNKQPIIST